MSLGRRVRNTGSLACELVLLLLPPLRMIDVFIEREREGEREREREKEREKARIIGYTNANST